MSVKHFIKDLKEDVLSHLSVGINDNADVQVKINLADVELLNKANFSLDNGVLTIQGNLIKAGSSVVEATPWKGDDVWWEKNKDTVQKVAKALTGLKDKSKIEGALSIAKIFM